MQCNSYCERTVQTRSLIMLMIKIHSLKGLAELAYLLSISSHCIQHTLADNGSHSLVAHFLHRRLLKTTKIMVWKCRYSQSCQFTACTNCSPWVNPVNRTVRSFDELVHAKVGGSGWVEAKRTFWTLTSVNLDNEESNRVTFPSHALSIV